MKADPSPLPYRDLGQRQSDAIEYRLSGTWLLITIVMWLAVATLLVWTYILPVIAIVVIIKSVIDFKTIRVVSDASGVTLRRGLVTLDHQRLPYNKIHAVTTRIGPIGRMFDFGTVHLTVGNDQTKLSVPNLEGCVSLREHLLDVIHR